MTQLPSKSAPPRESAVWIDKDRAIIVQGGPDELPIITVLTRGPSEGESRFEIRTVGQVLDAPRVAVSGPTASRLEFDRAYVALTHRPDRLRDDDRTIRLAVAPPAW